MNTTPRFHSVISSFFACVTALLIFAVAPKCRAAFSDTLIIERYTLIDGATFRYEQGYLLSSGQFKAITSDVYYYTTWGFTPDDFAPISGKPIMALILYNGYHDAGVLPNWTRSQATFQLGFSTYVIVAVKGKGDPDPAVTILTQPESDRVLAGGTGYFYVDAEPFLYLTYQWYFKNKPIPGETDSWLWINNVTAKNAGLYKCAISSGGKPVFSQQALLMVVQPVSIKTQPKTQTVKVGKAATFRVAVNGTGPFHYQWYWNTNVIPRGTNSFYSIPKAQLTNAGPYSVVVDNDLSWAYSNWAQLTVVP